MPELPDEAFLVRGQPLDRDRFEGSVRRHFKVTGIHGFSVFGIAGATPSEIVRRCRLRDELDLKGEYIRVTTAGAVRGAGYALDNDHSWHQLIVFPRKPTRLDWEAIDAIFSAERDAIIAGE
jgi:hypothetical protein